MPFWKSLLGGSSSSSKESGSSGSGSSSSLVNPGPSSSSSSPSPASSSGNTGSSSRRSGRRSSGVSDSGAAAKDSSIAATSSSSSSRKARAQSHPPPATAAASQPQPVPVPSSSDSSNHRDTNHPQTFPLPIGSSLSKSVSNNTTSGTSVGGNNTDLDIDTEGEDNAIPDTPFSSGHSPSHARHKFPGNDNVGGSVNGVDDNPDETLADSGSTAARTTSAFNPGSVSSNLSKVGSSSSLSSRSNPNNNNKPDIPTTHTILANPLPQPSSGLAAAISSVLPSSSSLSTSVGASSGGPSLGNGKASSSTTNPDGTPRTFDIDDMIQRLLDAGYSSKLTKSVCLKNSEITAICSAAREVFLSQPTLIELSPPVKIVGDVHGQYSDLIRLFEMCGFPPKSNYLFLGDYVDRGKQSLETILLLLCYKVKYPENFFLLRGNHECANVTRVYGFYDECKRRCNIKIWKTFIDVFNCLPITALVAGKIFCVHGGLSPSLSSMDDIRRISRPTDVPDYGLLNDLLWSDPSDTALDWEDNERGVSYCFGKAVIQDFLAKYDFDLICRAHMVVEDGYEFWNERTLVTIFSAPNYCGEFDNFGACMEVSEELLCSFILLKPLDGAALKKELAKGRKKLTSASSS